MRRRWLAAWGLVSITGAASVTVGLVGSGCEDEPLARPRGLEPERRGGGAAARGVAPGGPAQGGGRPGEPRERIEAAHFDPTKNPPAPLTERAHGPAATEAAAPARDLEAELRQLLGDPTSCFAGGAQPPERVQLQLTAVVTSQGLVTRASASGGGVTAEAARCLGRRIEAGRFRAPVEGAPRTLRTTVAFDRRPTPAPTGSAAPGP